MTGQDQVWASGQGSNDVVGVCREFARSSLKESGSSMGTHQRKTIRLTVRMSEAVGLAGVYRLYPAFLSVFEFQLYSSEAKWGL
ncbi:hypothetical protein GW17_00057477 [Ensete ventricosum]|uniref:Uncharacterized protein n=1 Tax=Ensete ventricosum TaxID=4639 RepID=A0A444C5R3_ENSVE|nr:hypothetical protein GW17_00057477 [Ensete ventricosum]RZR73405.1 hypothetical protein BHM03_00023721 [Ensete ventricosum]